MRMPSNELVYLLFSDEVDLREMVRGVGSIWFMLLFPVWFLVEQ